MSNAILFLYEGETEKEFYKQLIKTKVNARGMLFSSSCLNGLYRINFKVANAIDDFLAKHKGARLEVFVALDRDGKRPQLPLIDIDLIKSQSGKSLKEIHLIVATQVFESWLFIDIDNIYAYLKTPKSQRNPDKYKVYENFTHQHLGQLFKSAGKEYKKGRRVEGLINAIDIIKIYEGCNDLKIQIDRMAKICESK
jgi:hypothetical protein